MKCDSRNKYGCFSILLKFFFLGYMEIGNSCERLRCKESEIRSSVIYMFGNVKIKSVCNRNIKEFNNPIYIL